MAWGHGKRGQSPRGRNETRPYGLALVALCIILPAGPAHGGAATVRVELESGVRLVTVDMTVSDRQGNAVSDLRPEEIEVREDGVLVPILEFHPPDGSEPSEPVPTVVPTDRLSTVVVVLDTLDASRAGLLRIPSALEEFLLSVSLPQEAELLVCLLDQTAWVLGSDAAGRVELARRVAGLEPMHLEGRLALRPRDPLADPARLLLPSFHGYRPQGSSRGNRILDAFCKLGGDLADHQGRKAILWISAGRIFDRSWERLAPRRIRAWRQRAADARVALHAVDLEGLRTPTAELGLFMRLEWLRKGFLWQIADLGGGTLHQGDNDRAASMARAVSTLTGAYRVVYRAPDPGIHRGFREIEVTSSRRDVRIQARAGYDDRNEEESHGRP